MLTGKKVLVTGGSRGIGRATVTHLVQSGVDVVFTYHSNQEAAEALCKELTGEKGKVIAVQADSNNLEQARETLKAMKEKLGGIDGLVINAGVSRDKLLVMMGEDDWDQTISTNLKGTFNYTRAAVYDMVKQRSGSIVCISSVSGLKGMAGQTNYSATKAGQIGLVRSLAKEVAKFGVRVNAVAPGFIETDMWHELQESYREQMKREIPMGRPGNPEEVAEAVYFLLSPSARYITGSVLVIDGGLSA